MPGRRLLGALLPAAALLLAGCSSTVRAGAVLSATSFAATSEATSAASAATSTTAAASTRVAVPSATSGDFTSMIYGLVTDSGGMGLVASYIGGACDGPARLAVAETASRIDVRVQIGPDPKGPESCPAVGYSRTVAARLARPIGARPIFSGADHLQPFDGLRRLLPTALPSNFTKGVETSGGEPGRDADHATTRWSVTYFQPQPASNACQPTRGVVQVNLGPAAADDFASAWTATTAVSIAGHQARLWREGKAGAPTAWAYVWRADQGSVEVVARAGCQGDRILDPNELLRVAQSLKTS